MTKANVRIQRMLYGGGALAHHEGTALAVPYTLPGELTQVSFNASAEGQRRDAILDQVLQPSPDRVTPSCVHFQRCGGCQYQHINFVRQTEVKRQLLGEMLQRGGVEAPDITVHAGEPYSYRNRIQLRIERIDGRWHVGYNERSSHRFMPATMCPITTEPLWQLAITLCEALNGRSDFDHVPLHEAELMCNEDGSEMQAILMLDVAHAEVDRDAPAKFRSLCASIASMHSALRGAGLWVWGASSGRKGGRAEHRMRIELAGWGNASLSYTVAQGKFQIERGGFFQVNRTLLPRLIELATKSASGGHAWDLYAGVGLFTSRLLQTFAHVTAVEIADRSYRGLAAMLAGSRPAHRALQMDTLQFLKSEASRLPRPDLVLVDPPRSGLGGPVVRALVSVKAKEIRYVSCDPTTLVRDLKALIESGYCLAEFDLVDMFPQTFHMESVVRLVQA